MERKNIKCHFISNTHWDREWKFSAQRTRHMLVTAIDMLLDIFEKEPDYKHFHLDSQTRQFPIFHFIDQHFLGFVFFPSVLPPLFFTFHLQPFALFLFTLR